MLRSIPSDDSNALPEFLEISEADFRAVYPFWLQWRSTGKKFLPVQGGLRNQPIKLMADLLYIDMLYDKMLSQDIEQRFANSAPSPK